MPDLNPKPSIDNFKQIYQKRPKIPMVSATPIREDVSIADLINLIIQKK